MKKSVADEILGWIVNEMTPVSEVIDHLHSLGYNLTFTLCKNQVLLSNSGVCYNQTDFDIDHFVRINNSGVLKGYRLYVLQGPWLHVKGLLLTDSNGRSVLPM